MNFLIILVVTVLTFANSAMAAQTSNLSIELDPGSMQYRVHLGSGNQALEYDSLDLKAPRSGLAPRGAKVQVHDRLGRLITCGDPQGYSSAELHSGSPVYESSFKTVLPNNDNYSEWYGVADLLRGLDQCSKVPIEQWHSVTIFFSVRERQPGHDYYIVAKSDALELTPDRRNSLIAKLK